jgi:hypothetical protein
MASRQIITDVLLTGSRIVVSQGMYGQQRKIFVLSAIIQVARWDKYTSV